MCQNSKHLTRTAEGREEGDRHCILCTWMHRLSNTKPHAHILPFMSWRSVSFLLYAAEELIEPAVSQLIFLWSEFQITSEYMSWCVCWSVMEQTCIVAWFSGQLPVVKFEVLAISQALFTQLVLNLCSNFKLLILFLLFLLKLIHVCSIYSSTFCLVVFVCLLQFLHCIRLKWFQILFLFTIT